MLVISYRGDIVTPTGKTTRKANTVRMVRDWHPNFIGRSYTPRINHVHEDQVWLQTGFSAPRSKRPQEGDAARPELAVPPARGAGATEEKEEA